MDTHRDNGTAAGLQPRWAACWVLQEQDLLQFLEGLQQSWVIRDGHSSLCSLASVKAPPVAPARASPGTDRNSHMVVTEQPAGPGRTSTPGFLALRPGLMKPSRIQTVSKQSQHASGRCLLFTSLSFSVTVTERHFRASRPAGEMEAKFPALPPPHFSPASSLLESLPVLSIVPNRCVTRGDCQGRSCPHRGLDPAPSVSLELSTPPRHALRTWDGGASEVQPGRRCVYTRTRTQREDNCAGECHKQSL